MSIRDRIEASRQTARFDIPGLGEFQLKQISATERLLVMRLFREAAAQETDAERDKASQKITAQLVQLTLLDDDGTRAYGDDELDTLQDQINADTLDAIGDKAVAFCRLADDEDTAKKSKGTRKSAGSSGSA